MHAIWWTLPIVAPLPLRLSEGIARMFYHVAVYGL
jgi:hypothetical protein